MGLPLMGRCNSMGAREMTPFPPFGRVFIVGVSSVTPSLGVNGFASGWWKQWGIAPPAHLTEGNNPLPEAPPRVQNPSGAGFYKLISMRPT